MNQRTTGSYYTCERIASFMARWAVRKVSDNALEPSFGGGVFMDALLDRYRFLGAKKTPITGVELQPSVYAKAEHNYPTVRLICSDFLEVDPDFKVEVVVGNPPYVSLRNLDPSKKALAVDRAAEQGVSIGTSASLWLPFITHATSFLSGGGRMAYVLPYEVCYVKYALRLWTFLGNNFGSLRVIRIHEDFFPEVEVETVILLAEKFGGHTGSIEYTIFDRVDDLSIDNLERSETRCVEIGALKGRNKPFSVALLNESELHVVEELRRSGALVPLINECKFKIGYTSGSKEFFCVDDPVAQKYDIPASVLVPTVASSKELNPSALTMGADDCAHYLFYPSSIEDAPRYIEHGLFLGIQKRYKCRTRKAWYHVDGVETPDLLLTVFGDVPRLIEANGVTATNSLLIGSCRNGALPKSLLARWYNSLTLLSIELNVHSLGGGCLVFVPGEVDQLEIVNVHASEETLVGVVKQLEDAVSEDRDPYEVGDRIVLHDLMGMDEEKVGIIRDAVGKMRQWRRSRVGACSRSSRKTRLNG